MNVVLPDAGIPWTLNSSIITYNWYTIYEQIKVHWEKFWPIKKMEMFLASGRYPPPQLASAITALSSGVRPSLVNMHKEFMFYQSQDNHQITNDPTGCQYQGYYALSTSVVVQMNSQDVFHSGYYVSPKNGELMSMENSESAQDNEKIYEDAKNDSIYGSNASSKTDTKSDAIQYSIQRPNSKKSRDIILTNMDFERPNPALSSVRICKAASHTHPHIKISDDGKSISHSRGYRVAKATHGMFEGDWYYETILREGHARIGWGHSLSDIHAPIGYDEYGYGYGDVTGNVFHTGRPIVYSEPWSIGDVIGCRIVLPSILETDEKSLEELQKDYESKYPPLRAGNYKIRMTLHPGSFIAFYKNGKYLGKAFGPIYKGKYYPSISVYKGTIDVHFGPNDLQYYHSVTLDQKNMDTNSIPRPCSDMCTTKENFDYGIYFASSTFIDNIGDSTVGDPKDIMSTTFTSN